MKYWLPLVLIAIGACTQAASPAPSATSSELGLELVTPNAAQLNGSLLTKSANATPQTLRIRYSSLEQPLLYIAAFMETSAPNSHYTPFQPRFVKFSQKGNSIVLSDIRPHQRYTEDKTLPRIIAQFPIVRDDTDGIEFNFASGMKDTFTAEGRTVEGTQSQILIATPQHSYITQISSSPNTLSLEHHFTDTLNNKPTTFVLRHIFKQNIPTSITPREADASGTFGFFVTPPWYEFKSNEPHRYITQWDIQKPISVALSPNIPLMIHPAIESAIAGWNKVFGKDLLQIAANPTDQGPLDLRYDITINWVTNDANGTAIGYMFTHPVTGQILHGDLMLPSARLISISNYSTSRVSKLKKTQATPEGFDSAEVCNMTEPNSSHKILHTPTSADIETKLISRLIQQLVTHELGHILGLRHNFAGSSQGELTFNQEQNLLTQFVQGEDLDDSKLPASSIMDYLDNYHRIFMTRPGPYDVEAIHWGYLSPNNSAPKSKYRYCTDQDTNDMSFNNNNGTIADCQLFDFGPDPLLDAATELDWDISVYLNELVKLANSPADTLARTPLANLPSINNLLESLYRLHNYVTGKMLIWSTDEYTSFERFAKAGELLTGFQSLSVANDPLIKSTRDKLDQQIHGGDKLTQLRAIDGNLRLTSGIRKLEMLLDLKPGSLNKNPNGTAADFDYGD